MFVMLKMEKRGDFGHLAADGRKGDIFGRSIAYNLMKTSQTTRQFVFIRFASILWRLRCVQRDERVVLVLKKKTSFRGYFEPPAAFTSRFFDTKCHFRDEYQIDGPSFGCRIIHGIYRETYKVMTGPSPWSLSL